MLVFVPQPVIDKTVTHLRSFRKGRRRHEGIVYWAGLDWGETAMVTTCIVPKAETSPGSYQTSVQGNAQVIAWINAHHLRLLGQVHSHPGDMVRHSIGDNEGAFMPVEGYWSIVVPRYARQGMIPLSLCGVHRYEQRQFKWILPQDVEKSFIVSPEAIDLRLE